MFLLFALALSDTQRCNEYFCYNQKEETKELELIGLSEYFFFSSYGMMNSKPLNLDPNFDDGSILTSINFNFPQSYYSMKLSIPSTVKFIKEEAFYNVIRVSLNLTLRDDVVIGDRAFQGFTGLRSINFIGNAQKIGADAFKDCTGLQTISEIKAAEIGSGAFCNCLNMKGQLKISSITKTIGDEAFSGCYDLNGDLTIPESVTFIGKSAFEKCEKLDGTLTIKTSSIEISENAFKDTKFEKINYPGKISQNELISIGLSENIVVSELKHQELIKVSLYDLSKSSQNKSSIGTKVAIAFSVMAIVAFFIFVVIFVIKKVKAQNNYQVIK